MLRRASKGGCRAQVILSGFDVRDITKADPVATVRIDAPEDAKELARFVGMCVVAMLRNAVHTPDITEPFAKHGWIVSAELAEPPADADLGEFSIAAGVRPEDVVGLLEYEMSMAEITGTKLSTETMMTIKFPRVCDERRRGKKRRLRAVLHEGSAPFVALHSRNAMIAADGVLCMMEQIAHERPREVTQHVGAVCKRLFEIHRDLSGESIPSAPPSRSMPRSRSSAESADIERRAHIKPFLRPNTSHPSPLRTRQPVPCHAVRIYNPSRAEAARAVAHEIAEFEAPPLSQSRR